MLPGNHQWQLELYEGRAAELILYGRALGLGHEEAEDVVQETFVGLLHLSAPPINPWFYCLRAYRNRALNYRRSLWRRVKRELFAERWFEPAPLGDHREQAAMKCLERLPPEQREVIVLKIWHDQTFEVIAELLGVSPNTVSARYRYGLEKLRKCLKASHYEQLETTGNPFEALDAAKAV